jgi:hypothetical protein
MGGQQEIIRKKRRRCIMEGDEVVDERWTGGTESQTTSPLGHIRLLQSFEGQSVESKDENEDEETTPARWSKRVLINWLLYWEQTNTDTVHPHIHQINLSLSLTFCFLSCLFFFFCCWELQI